MNTTKIENESPIACVMTALNAAQRERQQILLKQLHDGTEEIRELQDGFAFRFPAQAASVIAAAEWITIERLCCPFLTFSLEVEREGGPAWLRLTGRDGVKEFLRMELGLK
jgi:hypothetical protein